jgi:hypothetical protein
VALAATIGGSLVGIAGVGATAWSNWLQRVSAKELASLQHQHERELARSARLFERREPVYEETLTLLRVWMDRVDLTERLYTSPGDPEPPELPDREKWRGMQARLGAIGSPEVSAAYGEFWDALEAFYERVKELRMLMQGYAEGEAGAAATRMNEARGTVGDMLQKLERVVSDELATL